MVFKSLTYSSKSFFLSSLKKNFASSSLAASTFSLPFLTISRYLSSPFLTVMKWFISLFFESTTGKYLKWSFIGVITTSSGSSKYWSLIVPSSGVGYSTRLVTWSMIASSSCKLPPTDLASLSDSSLIFAFLSSLSTMT